MTYLFVTCGLIGVATVFFLNQAKLSGYINSWQVSPLPQPYTELYFTKHQQLSLTTKAGTTQKLPFTIHNHEHQRITYRYKIIATLASNNTRHQLGEGTMTLAHDHSQTTDAVITLPRLNEQRTAIKVILFYTGKGLKDGTPHVQTQSIHYWVNLVSERHTHEDS